MKIVNVNQTADSATPLPDLHQGLLDSGTLEQYFSDLRQCAQVLEVRAKYASRQYASEAALTAEQAFELLLHKRAAGVQIRYVFEGDLWWDTIIPVAGGRRLTRIRPRDAGA